MSQTDSFHIPNLAGAPFRNLLNQILAALSDQNSGSEPPENPFAGMVWLDTAINPPEFKLRNADNTGWLRIFTAEHPPTKAQVGLSKVPNYSATHDLSDGSMDKFLLSAAGKTLQDNKLDKTGQAFDSARLGNVLANQFVQIAGTYPNLRAQATTKGDVGLGSVQNYDITDSLTSNNSKQYLSAKGGYDLNQMKVNKTVTINGHKLEANITLTPADIKALPAGGGDLGGPINHTLTTGDIIRVGGKTLLRRISGNGAASFGCDEALILGCGEARQVLEDNVSAASELMHLGSDGAIHFYTGLQSGWGARQVFTLDAEGALVVPNPERTREKLGVLSAEEVRQQARFIGEIITVSFEEPPNGVPGCFVLDGSRVPNGVNDFPKLVASGCKWITISGSDFILHDDEDFHRGQGSSPRTVGSSEADAIRNITGSYGGRKMPISDEPQYFSGAFYDAGTYSDGNSANASKSGQKIGFSASRVVPTASENRPKSKTVLRLLYHGEF